MKLSRYFVLFILIFAFIRSYSQTNKEIVIIGTMHQVPKIIKNAYKPMYQKAKKYAPETIFVEYVPSWDTLSIQFYYSNFLHLSDSISKIHSVDLDLFLSLDQKKLEEMTLEDFRVVKLHYLVSLDYANYKYYTFLEKYGKEGSKKSKSNENIDLSFRLAAKLGMKKVFPMDHQASNEHYYVYWKACSEESKNNGDQEKINSIVKRMTREEYFYSFFIGNGRYTNRKNTTETYHKLNSFRYNDKNCEPCVKGGEWWDYRNEMMAENIVSTVLKNDFKKNLVVVGAGHVYGLKDYITKHYPEIEVRNIYE